MIRVITKANKMIEFSMATHWKEKDFFLNIVWVPEGGK